VEAVHDIPLNRVCVVTYRVLCNYNIIYTNPRILTLLGHRKSLGISERQTWLQALKTIIHIRAKAKYVHTRKQSSRICGPDVAVVQWKFTDVKTSDK
jgi:hypothetical protein